MQLIENAALGEYEKREPAPPERCRDRTDKVFGERRRGGCGRIGRIPNPRYSCLTVKLQHPGAEEGEHGEPQNSHGSRILLR